MDQVSPTQIQVTTQATLTTPEQQPKTLTPLEAAKQTLPALTGPITHLETRNAVQEKSLQLKAQLEATKKALSETVENNKAKLKAAEEEANAKKEALKAEQDILVDLAKKQLEVSERKLAETKDHVETLLKALKLAQEAQLEATDKYKAAASTLDQTKANAQATTQVTQKTLEATLAQAKEEADQANLQKEAALTACLKALENTEVAFKQAAQKRLEYFQYAGGSEGRLYNTAEKNEFLDAQKFVMGVRTADFQGSTIEPSHANAFKQFINAFSDLLEEAYQRCIQELSALEAKRKEKDLSTLPLPASATNLFQSIYNVSILFAALDDEQTFQLKKAQDVLEWATTNLEEGKRTINGNVLKLNPNAQAILDGGAVKDLEDMERHVIEYTKRWNTQPKSEDAKIGRAHV